MQFPSFFTPADRSPSTGSTRHALTAKRRRARRLRVFGIAGAATVAAVACTGFVGSGVTGTPLPGASALGLPTPGATAGAHVTVTSEKDGRVSVHADSAVPRQTADTMAQLTLYSAQAVAAKAKGKVATSTLDDSLDSLADYRSLNPDTIVARVATTENVASSVSSATAVVDKRLAAEHAVAVKKAAAAQAAADAARQAAENTPAAAKATAKALLASQYGWGSDQYTCLVSLWSKESGWNYKAYNASGATGIPQALPGSKMSSVAADWSTNATTQIIWGLRYISGSYGTPCAAWSHSESVNWY